MSRAEEPGRGSRTRRAGKGGDGGRVGQVERDLARVLARLTADLGKPSLGVDVLVERALRDAARVSRGAADARDAAGPRWTAMFNRLLSVAGGALGRALAAHPALRVSDESAAASVVVHAIEGLVRRSAELPNARARSDARAEVVRMLKLFLGAQ